jgi:hypothetical protein
MMEREESLDEEDPDGSLFHAIKPNLSFACHKLMTFPPVGFQLASWRPLTGSCTQMSLPHMARRSPQVFMIKQFL